MNSQKNNYENFVATLKSNKEKTEKCLRKLLPDRGGNALADAMQYAVLDGGKNLRSFLVLESAAIFDVPENFSLKVAASVECIHSYSLVHDDLPSMDDDDLRRGKLTVHKKWDEATAILVGDGLQTLAFEILSNEKTHPNAQVRLNLIYSLAQAIGVNGMVGGQALDIQAEKARFPLNIKEITRLQNLKTSALITWSAQAGARLAEQDMTALTDYAKALGLAFQIQDDILDETGETKKTGKKLRKDAKAGKATFVSLLGLKEARTRARDLALQASEHLKIYGERATPLKEAALFAIDRNF